MCNKLFFLHGLLLQGVSVGTIKAKANVCCVQFPTDSGRTLAFGSADHRIYYYDLRNSKMPLCTLVGHNKTVSYVKFIDSTTLVSASTDNTIKLWDLSMCTSRVLDCPLQSFTGHLNVKVSCSVLAKGKICILVVLWHFWIYVCIYNFFFFLLMWLKIRTPKSSMLFILLNIKFI